MKTYMKALIIGVILAALLIGGGVALKFILKLLLQYWTILLVGVMAIIFIRRFMSERKQKLVLEKE